MVQLRSAEDRAALDDLCVRTFSFDDVEFRDDGPTGFSFEGVASVVDFPYPVRDAFGVYQETIKAGAFDTTLRDKKATISLYKGHAGDPYAVRSAKATTLTLVADPHLRVKADLDPERTDVRNLTSMLKRRELTEMSIGFRPVRERDKWNKDYTEVVRTQVSLREVSIVELGANIGGTEAAVRSLDDFMSSIADVEMDEAEMRRALAFFQERLDGLTPEPNEFDERDRLARERLDRLMHDRLPLIVG